MEKNSEGYIKGVLSGDYIVVSGKLKKNSDDVPEEKNLFLSLLSAPKLNSQTSYEEDPCGWESRNYLRNLIIGKIVKYSVDYTSGDNLVGQVFYEGKNINLELVKKGLAKVNTNKSNESVQKTDFYKQMLKAQEEAERSKLGIWKNDKNQQRIKITKQDDVDVKALFDEVKGKELDGMLEVAFNCAGFLVLLKSHNCVIKASLRFVAIPNKDTFFYKAGKAYVERLFLHRDVKVKLIHLDDNRNFTIDVYDTRPGTTGKMELKNLGLMVLTSAYSKLYVSTNFANDKKDVEAAKEAQAKGQLSAIRVWEGYIKKAEKETKTSTVTGEKAATFEGKVQFIHSGDSLSIKSSEDGSLKRVFFSHMKAPVFAKPNTEEEDKPWAWEAKNHLIKIAIGKKVRAEFDFSREMKEGRVMNFYSVILIEDGLNTNLNYEMLEHGYAICNPPRGNDNDASNYLENYIEAELKAKEKKLHLFSNKNPGIPNYCDIIQANPKKKKDMIARNQGLRNTPCVVEHVFSATRFKLRIDKTTCFIPFKLVGLRSVEKDKNNSKQLDDLHLMGVDYVSDLFLQREGVCDIIQTDKSGNYFGFLTVKGVNVGSDVLNQGHAIIYNPQNNLLPSDYKKQEAAATKEKKGIWSCEGLSSILTEGEITENPGKTSKGGVKYNEKDEQVKLRVTDMLDFKSFYANIIPNKSLSTIEKVLAEYEANEKQGIPLEPPIKKGINCILKYPVDLKYYRVKILNSFKDDTMEVDFFDYGTVDTVPKRNLFKMDDRIATISPQVVECELANLKYSKNSMKKSMALYPDFIDLENIVPAKIAYTYITAEGKLKHGIVVYFEKYSNYEETVHYDLISKGYAKIDVKKPVGKAVSEFKEAEKTAKSKSLGMWAEMEESDNEDEE